MAVSSMTRSSLLVLTCVCFFTLFPPLILGDGANVVTDTNRTILLTTLAVAIANIILYPTTLAKNATSRPIRPLLTQVLDGLFIALISIPFLYFNFVCFGAPLLEKLDVTLSACVYVSCLAYMPIGILCGIDQEGIMKLLLHQAWRDDKEALAYTAFIGTHFGMWVGAIAVPLDWDRPWQPWPISSCIACTCVYASSALGWGVLSMTKWSPVHTHKAKSG
ncbi:hypothetical protein SARC_07736 [Sphaeroforma arctica JP610]|uniref:Glycosylphosphatidylinositol anchor biosynthesis protein 11 n=1 Tax=Sphaeroforma arctica JP610 TaxID=667725 RepID=A0A0L0FSU5_9EUKA|nr:hypothetical protein SARC_07736 [Sphaeroforma arctica JP610]KNC79882.1 hypothetical protein SARC_07736 [Sphaeroforma arctica JP610]|eukprot:XP_014153784.1 hypothetical protein SARC_07736 [Sphaeroforma arctica JP610]